MSAIAAKTPPAKAPDRGVETVYAESAEIGPAMNLMLGKSTLLRLPGAIDRISVGNPNVADVTLISARELYLLGKTVGSTNVILWRKGGATTIVDVSVNVDAGRLQSRIHELLPGEQGIRVTTAAESIVLTGEVSSSLRAEEAVSIAEAYVRNLNRGLVLPVVAGGGQVASGTTISVGESRSTTGAVRAAGSQVVNMMRVSAPQQVMLEVKVAEISKTLLDKLGAEFRFSTTGGNWTYSIINSLLTDSAGVLTAIKSPTKLLAIDAEKRDGLLKILAEPNIVAISGQEGSFLAGGKIFIPVARANATTGGTTITLEEKEFGVGLKFTPTVLDGGRINLKVAPEVSELSQTGSPFTTIDGTTAILPSFTVRRAQTTVQLIDGQSFAIAGLIKNNVTESVKRFPGLGEIPILGALFRSSEFQTDRSELMFVITPRLVKPLAANYALPTDNFVPPSRGEFFLEGRMEGRPSFDEAPAGNTPSAPADGGFQTR
ncbi:type II and III secretion system protein family protein [Aromatoleum toluvorans]|uniref:Type II and III secretion system protein family protein n=2 Tax=Aromatoleum toluvorans TaxID=92002 RepID=A0ABX1PY83_9RHOO|nr:type II and III secretion system protein family protein [Aromatoleum toluvorans]